MCHGVQIEVLTKEGEEGLEDILEGQPDAAGQQQQQSAPLQQQQQWQQPQPQQQRQQSQQAAGDAAAGLGGFGDLPDISPAAGEYSSGSAASGPDDSVSLLFL